MITVELVMGVKAVKGEFPREKVGPLLTEDDVPFRVNVDGEHAFVLSPGEAATMGQLLLGFYDKWAEAKEKLLVLEKPPIEMIKTGGN